MTSESLFLRRLLQVGAFVAFCAIASAIYDVPGKVDAYFRGTVKPNKDARDTLGVMMLETSAEENTGLTGTSPPCDGGWKKGGGWQYCDVAKL